MQSFQISVPDELLNDLKLRLARTRWPSEVNGLGMDLWHEPLIYQGAG